MANKSLGAAKKAKNDEFYTQYSDIQKEIEAYLEYDENTFNNKVVYCNCDDPFESNFFRYFVLNFKRLGLKQLITTSYKPSPIANTELVLQPSLFPDYEERVMSNPLEPKGRPKITANKFIISSVGDIDGDGSFTLQDIAEQLKANKHNEWAPLKGEGDFRSPECVELLKQADIVITNPPFSLFREYIKQLFEYSKKFIVLSNKGAVLYKEVFPLLQDNKLWSGRTSWSGGMWFETTNLNDVDKIIDGKNMKNVPSIWLTNIDHGRRHQQLTLMTVADNLKFNKKMKDKIAYDKYDNYNAIEVSFTNAIPSDYDGIMGVPSTFLDKYNPDQFEIVGMCENLDLYKLKTKKYTTAECKQAYFNKFGKAGVYDMNASGVILVGGRLEKVYQRVLIRRKK